MDYNEITLHIIGKSGDEKLTPANFDITQIRFLIDEMESLLYPDKNLRKKRPIISYEMQEGSVKNIFRTTVQNVLMFSAMINMVEKEDGSIDKLDANSAKAIENLQAFALRHDYQIEIGTSDKPERTLKISPQTHYQRHESIMVDAEVYYYGRLIDAGGKDRANIHLDTKDAGLLTIHTDREFLAKYDGNPLYRNFGVRVRAKQNTITKDIDTSTLSLVEFIDYQPDFDADYLDELINKATPNWSGIDADEWLRNLRGGLV